MSLPEASAEYEVQKNAVPLRAEDMGGAEMLRLVQRLFLSTKSGSGPRQVVFCGIGVENGSSSVCANAGKTLAVHSSRPVCLVDANLHSSRLLGILGKEVPIVVHSKPTSVRERCLEVRENLWFAGSDLLADEGGGLVSASRLREIFAELRANFEFLLIDAPGADVSGDAAILGQAADGTVLVIDAESTRRIAARKVKESLDAANVKLLGAVLHDRSFPIPKGLYNRL